MRGAALLGALVLVGCTEGPNPDTVIDGLTVLAAALEPTQPTPGQPFEVTATVGDPDGGAVVGAWTCAGDCATTSSPVDVDTAALTLTSEAPGTLWVLACSPGVCDPSTLDEQTRRDPVSWMATMPLDGVFLASRALVAPEGEPPPNPVVLEAPELPAAEPGAPTELSFVVPGAATAYGFASAGGFERASYDVASDGSVTLSWIPPEDGEHGRVWVVFRDELGGTAVWAAPVGG
ncbi:MAG: hypothetical protein H6738_03320 [Alphaproteobacteria bacterium]|nr:hypothetical protein [Alphaproteobacteria bacterium]MCB9695797.1 hypothetical protein [Alphaproteobacteria bacterium]